MKKIMLLWTFYLICSPLLTHATASKLDSIPAFIKDVDQIDHIIHALYNVISGPAQEKRNWDRMRTLFISEAKLIATGIQVDKKAVKRVMSVEEYIQIAGPALEKNGFFERELSRRTEQFGNIVHCFSTYESKRALQDTQPFMRGINSIQLWFDGNRWWIVNVLWQSESPELPIPEKYLLQ